MVIELLYFEECPSWQTSFNNLDKALEALEIDERVRLIKVETPEEAATHRFVGSPSIRINGQDLFPVQHDDYGLGCRVYQTEEGMLGWPTFEMLNKALTDWENQSPG